MQSADNGAAKRSAATNLIDLDQNPDKLYEKKSNSLQSLALNSAC